MKEVTPKFDKVLNAAAENRNINHEPDSSKEQQRNTPQKSFPFSDQIGNCQCNRGIPTKGFLN